MAKKKESVAELFQIYLNQVEMIRKAKETLDAMEADAKMLKNQLLSLIPADTEKEGVRHSTSTRRNVKYAEALRVMRDRLIPKTKQAEADVIVEEFTTVTVIDKLEAV